MFNCKCSDACLCAALSQRLWMINHDDGVRSALRVSYMFIISVWMLHGCMLETSGAML